MLFSYKADTEIASLKLHRKLYTPTNKAEATSTTYRQ